MMPKRLTKIMCSSTGDIKKTTHYSSRSSKRTNVVSKPSSIHRNNTSSELNNETKAVYISESGLFQETADKIPSCYLMHFPVPHGNFREEKE